MDQVNKGADTPKKKLNLSIGEDLIKYAKHYALNEDITVSQLVEEYFQCLKSNNGEVRKAVLNLNKTQGRPPKKK